jgi:type VI protein secretion system component VasK
MSLNSNPLNLGGSPKASSQVIKIAAFSVLLSVAMLLFLGNKFSWFADNKAQEAVVKAVQKYESLQQSSNKISICVQAGVVTSAYLQIDDAAKHQEWEAIEKKDCEAAGVPNY